MEKIDLGVVKKSFRVRKGVEQILTLYSRSQKELIMEQVMDRPDGVRIEDVLKMYDISPVVYHSWVRSMWGGKSKMNSVIQGEHSIPMTNLIKIKKISVEVDINDVKDLFKMIQDFCKIDGVKSVSA